MPSPDRAKRPSYVTSLFTGRPADELVLPYPEQEPADLTHTRELAAVAREYLATGYDAAKAEEDGWIGDGTVRALGERGLLGLFVSPEYGGAGLSQTGCCRVMEEFGRVDGTLSVVMGVHQSIGTKPIHLFGTDDQKARWLPDLAAGRKLAAFALTEPNIGSDAYSLETRAERQPDGSWLLNGEKRWIGNGDRDVLTVFARSDLGHVALVVEGGTEGVEATRLSTVGLRANRVQRVRFTDVRVPAENLLGEPGDGFRIAMATLNNGRMSMGTSIAGGMKRFLELSVGHTTQRHQFGRPLIDFEMVEDKIGWIAAQTYGLEALSYLTTGLVDRGAADFAMESAITKVVASDVGWYALNRAFQLHGAAAYQSDHPLAKALRDFRIFPIFEGSNDVMRAYVALNGLKALGAELEPLRKADARRPISAARAVAPYLRERVQRSVRPPRLRGAAPALAAETAAIAAQTAHLRAEAEKALSRWGRAVQERQLVQRHLFTAAAGITQQTAVLGRLSAALDRGDASLPAEQALAARFLTESRLQVDGAFADLEQGSRRGRDAARVVRQAGGYPLA
ncbi:MAG: acyl-CoA dehydrogenase family er 9 [Microbacteriaceae bacterium]|jgi:acyl-CoA dehydrogenase family protein 9|nr:acyl-CoA dehydrogenase family er 9 [Microbacteriaceae bacterium]